MRRARRWAGELTCDAATSIGHSAVAPAAIGSTIFCGCITLVGLRRRRRLVIPPILQRVRYSRRALDCYVARDSGYITIAIVCDGVDGRSDARERNAIVRQNPTKRHFWSDLTHPGLRQICDRCVHREERRGARIGRVSDLGIYYLLELCCKIRC